MSVTDVKASLTATEVPWRTCAVCHALANMDDAEAATLRDLLADRGIKFKTLAKALEDDPDTPAIDWQALSRHARGGCAAKERLR